MRAPLDRSDIELLTFDCYGTLIDWIGGVRTALGELPSLHGCDLERLVRDRDQLDRDEVLRPYAPYREKLAATLRGAARRQAREVSEADLARFVATMPSWPPFDETAPCLRRLGARHRLAILSNVDTRVLEASIASLGAPFEFAVTAEQVRSYKPARAHWDEALRRSGVAQERVLHVAASSFHDVRPALALGFRVAWINRERESAGAEAAPDISVDDLGALCARLGC